MTYIYRSMVSASATTYILYFIVCCVLRILTYQRIYFTVCCELRHVLRIFFRVEGGKIFQMQHEFACNLYVHPRNVTGVPKDLRGGGNNTSLDTLYASWNGKGIVHMFCAILSHGQRQNNVICIIGNGIPHGNKYAGGNGLENDDNPNDDSDVILDENNEL